MTWLALTGFFACGSKTAGPPAVPSPDACEDVGGVTRCVLQEGTGAIVEPGPLQIHYTGWLPDGTQFDSSRDRGTPFSYEAGAGRVIRGWEVAVPGMRYGGRYLLTIPPEYGYGRRGVGAIPPNSILTFEIEPIPSGS